MRTLFALLALTLTAQAGEIAAPNMDAELAFRWKTHVMTQGFALLPPSAELPETAEADPRERTRFILHVDTSHLKPKMIFGDGNYWMQYETPGQGRLLLIIHPKYKSCFEGAAKKFQEMQLVVFENGGYGEGWKGVVVEALRQCKGGK